MAGETKSPTRVTQLIESCSDSHAEIAEKLGVDKSLVTRWRNGERKPNAAHMAKLERLYGSANVARPLPPPPALDDEDEPEDVGADLAEDDAFDSDEANSVRLNRFIRNGKAYLLTHTPDGTITHRHADEAEAGRWREAYALHTAWGGADEDFFGTPL